MNIRCCAAFALLLALCGTASAQELGPASVDLRHTFFSRRDSWMALYPTEKPGTLRYYFSRMSESRGNWLDLAFQVKGTSRPMAMTADPTHLSIRAGGLDAPSAMVYLLGRTDTVVDVSGMELAISSVKKGLDLGKVRSVEARVWEVEAEGWTLRVEVLRGRSEGLQGREWRLVPEDGRLRLLLRLYRGTVSGAVAVDPVRDLALLRDEWAAWRAKMPTVAPERKPLAEAAWWDLWSLYAPPDVNFPTEAVLVSKVDMNGVWPWDHCFVTLALGLSDLDAALDQFMIPFANQDSKGQLPDQMLPEDIYRGCTKPPVHGWTLMKLMERHRFSKAQLERLYPLMERWTEFWFAHRDDDKNGIPAYGGQNSGWDSGWDNATVLGNPKAQYEAPDLQAYLVLQMKAMARMAKELGRIDASKAWEVRASAHLKCLRERFWNGRHFVTRQVGQATVDDAPTSLLPLMPLVLGDLLDKDIFDILARDLERRFLTPYGPATEDPTSPHYRPDGYWRGPIWAPSTYLLVDGLRRGGRKDLAKEIARRFCDMVARMGGHYENYDSLSGQGLRGKGFAWTASVDLLLLHEYLLPEAKRGAP